MWPLGGSIFPSGTSLMIGAHSASPSSRAIASQLARSTKLCLPVASQGPLGSTPPVGMMAVVMPSARASRTSIHVISSIQTVFGAGSGFGVSRQL